MSRQIDKLGSMISKYQKGKMYLAAPFAIYVVVWFLHIGDRREWLAALRPEMLLAIILIVLAIFRRPNNGYGIINHSIFKITALFLIIVFMQVVLSQSPETSWTVFITRVVNFSFMAWFICMFVRSPDQLRLFIGAFLFACFYELLDTFRGLVTGGLIWENQGIMRLHGQTSLTSHPNSLAGFALGVFPYVWYLFPVLKKKIIKLFLIVLLLLGGICLLYSGSRTGYVGLCSFFFILILRSKNKTRAFIGVILLLSILPAVVPGQYKDRFSTIFKEGEGKGSSAIKRIEIMKDAVEVFKKYPFGVGVSAFPAVRERMFGRTQDTHNLYFEVATNLGVQGLIVFVVLVWKILKSLLDVGRKLENQLKKLGVFTELKLNEDDLGFVKSQQRDLKFMIAICNATTGYIVIRLTLGLFGMDLYEIYWWFGIGITIAITNMNLITEMITNEFVDEAFEE